MNFERQTSWGILIVSALFFSGMGGGCFFFSFILELQNKYEIIFKTGKILSPIFTFIGLLCLLIDLKTTKKFYRIFLTPSSWMTRGSFVLLIFFLCELGYSLPSLELFEWLPWDKTTSLGKVMLMTAVPFSFLAMIYPAFLLGAVKNIPSWDTAALFPLFLFFSLYNGLAVLLLITILSAGTLGNQTVVILNILMKMEIVLIIFGLLCLYSLVETMLNGNLAAKESIFILIKGEFMGLFIGGVVIIGLIVPFFMLISSILIKNATPILILTGISSILILMGGFLLRYAIVKTGVYSPLYY
ncbi:MAG: NrfD/PsrC family molybdoenzyme membrane anchor subunit [Thermodesulfobacteriota bacterium]|nr:NrfD/PsrC family molybdoenzyme membrane anchor subunit [Thermodesulfobacteriota bacterium]